MIKLSGPGVRRRGQQAHEPAARRAAPHQCGAFRSARRRGPWNPRSSSTTSRCSIERGNLSGPSRVSLSTCWSSHSPGCGRSPDMGGRQPVVLMEMTSRNLMATGERVEHADFLSRVDTLAALGRTVMISNYSRSHIVTRRTSGATRGRPSEWHSASRPSRRSSTGSTTRTSKAGSSRRWGGFSAAARSGCTSTLHGTSIQALRRAPSASRWRRACPPLRASPLQRLPPIALCQLGLRPRHHASRRAGADVRRRLLLGVDVSGRGARDQGEAALRTARPGGGVLAPSQKHGLSVPMFREAVVREPWQLSYRTWKALALPDRGCTPHRGARREGHWDTGRDIILIQQSELPSQRVIEAKRRGEIEKRMTKDIPLFESAVMDGLQALFADLLTLEANLGIKRSTKSMPRIFEVIFCLEQPPESLCSGFLQSPPPLQQYPSENSDLVLPKAAETLARNR